MAGGSLNRLTDLPDLGLPNQIDRGDGSIGSFTRQGAKANRDPPEGQNRQQKLRQRQPDRRLRRQPLIRQRQGEEFTQPTHCP